MSSSVGAGPSTSGGFKLTLKLGGSSSSVQSASIAASTPIPAPSYSALAQLATSALEHGGSTSTHHAKRVEERAAKSVRKSREKRSEALEEGHVSAGKYRTLKREFAELQSVRDSFFRLLTWGCHVAAKLACCALGVVGPLVVWDSEC